MAINATKIEVFAPWRIEPGQPLLVWIGIDSTITLSAQSIVLVVGMQNGPRSEIPITSAGATVGGETNSLEWIPIEVPLPSDIAGELKLKAVANLRTGKKVESDEMSVHASTFLLPRGTGWYPGDPDAYIANGYALPPGLSSVINSNMATTTGLAWIANREIANDGDSKNTTKKAPILSRREVAVRGNQRSQPVAVLIGDRLPKLSDGDLRRILAIAKEINVPVFAGVPDRGATRGNLVSFLTRSPALPLWNVEDLLLPGLRGCEIHLGEDYRDKAVSEPYQRWREANLEGGSLCLISAHEKSGLFAQTENDQSTYTGRPFTHVFCPQGNSTGDISAGLSRGRTVISNGPFLSIELAAKDGKLYHIGDRTTPGHYSAVIRAASSKEFGPIHDVRLIIGTLHGDEEFVDGWVWGKEETQFEFTSTEVEFELPPNTAFVRAELDSGWADSPSGFAFTSPIWIGRADS